MNRRDFIKNCMFAGSTAIVCSTILIGEINKNNVFYIETDWMDLPNQDVKIKRFVVSNINEQQYSATIAIRHDIYSEKSLEEIERLYKKKKKQVLEDLYNLIKEDSNGYFKLIKKSKEGRR